MVLNLFILFIMHSIDNMSHLQLHHKLIPLWKQYMTIIFLNNHNNIDYISISHLQRFQFIIFIATKSTELYDTNYSP